MDVILGVLVLLILSLIRLNDGKIAKCNQLKSSRGE